MMRVIDTDGNGALGFPEFLRLMQMPLSKDQREQELREAFRVFDKDGSGLVTANEMRVFMASIGERLTMEEVRNLPVHLSKVTVLLSRLMR